MTIIDERKAGRPGRGADGADRLFAAGPEAGFAEHQRVHGAFVPEANTGRLLHELERAGLTGRGGAGFAAWRKLDATLAASQGRSGTSSPVVIANGAEGEPRSWKDAALLRNSPHLVLDGLFAAGAALGASKLYLYAPRGGLDAVAAAIRERPDAHRVALVESAAAFVSGEASAVVRAIETQDARPRDHIHRLSESGLKKRPTLVHNVETLAHLALIARHGAGWFRSAGSVRDPGTRLVTVSGDVQREGVFEVPGDLPIGEIVRAAGVDPAAVAAVLVGGYHGSWLAGSHLELPLSAAGLESVGASPGAGVLYVLARHRCGLAATAEILAYLAAESAQQCGPCMFGLPALSDRMTALATGHAVRDTIGDASRLADLVGGRGACHHPDGTARLARSALTVFGDDVEAHLVGRCTRQPGS